MIIPEQFYCNSNGQGVSEKIFSYQTIRNEQPLLHFGSEESEETFSGPSIQAIYTSVFNRELFFSTDNP